LINDTLDLSKVEAGRLDLEVGESHLRRLLEGSVHMVKEKALKHRSRLLTEMDGISEVIPADERKLKQILYHLLSNAAKFTPEEGRLRFRRGICPFGMVSGSPEMGRLLDDPWIRKSRS